MRENREFRILSAIGILLVMFGHLGYGFLEIGELFPYYSFQVFIFLFISGYFYKVEAEERIGSYIVGKVLTLLIPYFIWNLIYGVIATGFHHFGFTIGDAISFRTLFLEPFISGHQFMYNYPAWFVPVLFIIEVINVCMRKVLKLIHLDNDWLIMAGLLVLGMATVWLAIGGHVWGYYKIPGRLLFMLPGFQMGRIYKEKLEKHDNIPSSLYLLIVMGVQVLITILCAGLAFSAVWVSSFANGPIVPYLTVITGIAFWLRIAKVTAKLPGIAEPMVIMGRNTFSLMMHHTMGFMLVKLFFYMIATFTPLCSGFDREMFFSEINFVYLAGGSEASKWVYIVVAIAFSMLLAWLQHRMTDGVHQLLQRK